MKKVKKTPARNATHSVAGGKQTEKENLRHKLTKAIATAAAAAAAERTHLKDKKLAEIAKEKENVRRKLLVTAKNLDIKAKQLAVTAKEKESIRGRLEITAKQLATTAEEKEDVRHRLAVTAKKLVNIARAKENVRKKLAVTTEKLRLKTKLFVDIAIEKEKTKRKLAATTAATAAEKYKLEAELEQQKEINKMKTEFVSFASHQLRTPLTSVKWYSEMLLKENAGQLNLKQKKYIKELYQGNERMIDLVRNLLNVSRIEMGVLFVNPKPTDIEEMLQEIIKEQAPFVQEKKHEVVVEIPDGLPKISTDSGLVRMIFQNLFGNAIEYTLAGGKITCTAEKKDSEIIIGIKDTGIGIPEKQQNQIFQKLFRGDNAVREHSGGTGLELYITKAMVDALSGKI